MRPAPSLFVGIPVPDVLSRYARIERAAEDVDPFLRIIDARRKSANKPRGKLANGKSLSQLVEAAVSKPELVDLCGKDAWRVLPRAMAEFGITLTEIPGNEITEDRYACAAVVMLLTAF